MSVVYCAGKISVNDWRSEIFRGLRDVTDRRGGSIATAPDPYRGHQDTEPLYADGWEYGGPFFIGCDHGGFHGPGSHGRGGGLEEIPCCAIAGERRALILARCFHWLTHSDAVFAWIDKADCHGTLVELGYAHASGIPSCVLFARRELAEEVWFASTLATHAQIARTASEGWTAFCRWWATPPSRNGHAGWKVLAPGLAVSVSRSLADIARWTSDPRARTEAQRMLAHLRNQ